MKSEDAKKFTELLDQLSEIFDNGNNVSELKTMIYFDILANYLIEKIEIAIKKILKTRIYPGLPKPAEIIQMIEEDSDGFH
jgi:mannitol/fructose-specific phosphotransferase system IIA component (Ntr-type)